MKSNLSILIFIFFTIQAVGQSIFDTDLPLKLRNLSNIIEVNHFPSPVKASKEIENPGIYFWKHNTALLSPAQDIKIEEGGAYIFYNNQWNLRVTYSAKEFSKLFNIPEGKLQAGEPYTFSKNWRTDSRLLGGWAMWYVIGTNAEGKRVCGFGILETAESTYQ